MAHTGQCSSEQIRRRLSGKGGCVCGKRLPEQTRQCLSGVGWVDEDWIVFTRAAESASGFPRTDWTVYRGRNGRLGENVRQSKLVRLDSV